MSCSSVYCISGTNSSYDGSYSSGSTLHNGYIYYTGDTTPTYFIFYSTGGTESNWCLSTALDGPCLLFGKSPCLSSCPDLCTEFFSSGTCPAPTPSATPVCDVDFTAVLECSISPTPTQTPSQTPTQTPTPTPTPSDVCGGVSMVVSGVTYTPTPTPTISLTPSSTPDVTRPCSFSGTVAFNTLDDYIRCSNSKKFRDCSNGFLYHTSELILDEFNQPIQVGYVYRTTINGVSTCVVYDGLVDNISGADDIIIVENIGLEVDNGCNNCTIIPSQTPTPTPTQTPEVLLNNYFATKSCGDPSTGIIEAPSSGSYIANDGNCYQAISETSEPANLTVVSGPFESPDCNGCCLQYIVDTSNDPDPEHRYTIQYTDCAKDEVATQIVNGNSEVYICSTTYPVDVTPALPTLGSPVVTITWTGNYCS